jgi:hypothetical protein
MRISNSVAFLRRVLFADAALSFIMALLLIFGATVIESITALPKPLLYGAGWVLVPWVSLVVFAATRKPLRAPWVWAIVALNAAWVIDSIALLFMPAITANALGVGFVIAQALVVGVLAALQSAGLPAVRRTAQA